MANLEQGVDLVSDLIHVLYVDDEYDFLKIGKILLEQMGGFTVTTVSGAYEAIDLLKTLSFDAIISDYLMPRMNGVAFLKYLKSEGITTPFILFNGKGSEEVVIEALNNGADFYVQKGGDPKALFAELSINIRSTVMRTRAEKELLESQKKILDIMEFLPDATYAINSDGIIIAWNQAMESLTGFSKTRMLNSDNYASALPWYKGDRPSLIDLVLHYSDDILSKFPHISKEGEKLISEFFAPSLNEGKGAYLWVTASPLYDSGGVLTGAIESIRDISAYKLSEMSLFESESRYRLMHNASQDFIYSYDLFGRFTSVNRALSKALNLRTSDIIGITLSEVGFPSSVCLDWKELHQKVIDTNTTVNSLTVTLMPDGSVRQLDIMLNPLHDENGVIIGIAGTTRDITEKVKAQEELRESNSYLENLISIASVPILIWDASNHIIRINHSGEQLIGLNATEILGNTIQILFPSESAEKSMNLIASSISNKGDETLELDILHASGTIRTVRWNLATLYDKEDQYPIATIAQGQDITERIILEQERDTLELQIQQNIAKMSILNDGIRNPLMVITTYADMLGNSEIVETIIQQVNRIDKMVNEIDERWSESEIILKFLRKHCEIETTLTKTPVSAR